MKSSLAIAACIVACACGASTDSPSETHTANAPRIDGFTVSPSADVQPGLQISVSYSIYDDAGVHRSTITLIGAANLQLEQNEGDVRSASRSVLVTMPADTKLDTPLRVELQIFNMGGKSASALSPLLTVSDKTAPHVAGGLMTSSGADASTVGEMATAAGDPVRIRVVASDNHQLAWVGWRLGAPANTADSVAVTGTQGEDNTVVAAGPTWVGTSPVTIFARDAAGNLAEGHPTVDRLMVYSSRAATIKRAPLGRMVLDWAYDQPHDRLVVLLEDSTTIYTVPLGTFTPDAPVQLPEVAGGLDVTPNGDSLLITLPQSAALGEWQIGSSITTMSRLPISFDGTIGVGPERVKIASNGKALISLAATTGTAAYRFITLDLASGTQRKRTDVGPLSWGGRTLLVPSWDGTRILATFGAGCCQGAGVFYEAGRDGFFASPALEQVGPSEPTTADSTGAAFLMGSRYVGGDLFTPATIQAPGYMDYYYSATAIAPDGTRAYFARPDGYTTIRLSDRQIVEAVTFTPPPDPRLFVPYRYIALPNGRMAGWSPSGELFLVSPR